MAVFGFHPYLLAAESYEVAHSLPPPPPPPPPQRLRTGELGRDFKQADIIFSRRDVEWLD